ncbi:type VI secretion system baseplate subunit TssG [Massilia sp. S19_KUP03_FR1]|uniref:type VI secretion system baseplate subunit TssG n=1 Tax=Massilia sp. S19_KUP03_FR1 TaxID=3025503 RepID=UPI002FCD9436
MQTTQRQHPPGVIARLQDAPWQFEFVQLITLLLRQLRSQGVTSERAFRDVLRFHNSLSLSFPASEVCAVSIETEDNGAIKKMHVTPAFIGLLGASGTLPAHDTERIALRYAVDRDTSEHALVDVFSNRVIGLFFDAWRKYRVEQTITVQGQDRLLPLLTALAGKAGSHSNSSDTIRAYYAALLRTRPVAAGTMAQILSHHFGVPIAVEQLVGAWDPIPPNRRSTLGSGAPVLGYGATLGVRLWRHDLRARLRIGPLDEDQLTAFLPGGHALAALAEMMRLFAVPMVRFEVLRLLKPACVKRLRLRTADRKQLGWNTFLISTDGVTKRPEIGSMLDLKAKAGA